MSNSDRNQVSHLGSERLLDRDYIELRNRIAIASRIAEEYYTYLDNARNGRTELKSVVMSQYLGRIILANNSLWKLLKLAPYEHKDQYKLEKQAMIRILREQIVKQQQKEELEKVHFPIQ